MTRRFTGLHMTLIIVAFFGVVIVVNMVMAVAASRTFGGKVVDNSYVASQRFNQWIAEGRAQARLGWTGRPTLNPNRQVVLELVRAGAPVDGASVHAVARHPLGRAPDLALGFIGANGRYVSTTALPAGRWQLQIEVRRGGQVFRLAETLS
ncbi:MAG: FixH family protein [Sphingomonas sp.]